MSKGKWRKWLIWSGASLVVLGTLGYVGMNMAVLYTLKSIDSSSNHSAPYSNSLPNEIRAEDTIVNGQEQTSNEKNESQGFTNKADKKSANSPSNSASSSSANPLPPFPTDKGGQNLAYQAEVTKDKTKAVESSITLKEKMTVSSVLLEKLSASEIQLFAKMAGNGLSIDEKKAAKKVILGKLTEDEYNQLIQIAAKYGLSEGKNYSDSLKEK